MPQSRADRAGGDGAADRRRRLALVVLAVTQLVIVVDMTIVNVALPSVSRDLAITDANRQWVVTAYTLAFAGLLLLGGRVADQVGRRRALLVGLAGFAVASAVGGMAVNLAMLLIARATQGAFAALLAPASLALVTTTFTEPAERARTMGLFAAVVAAGSPIGLVAGGALTTLVGWPWVFYVNVAVAVLAGIGAVRFLDESRADRAPGYDLPGAVLGTAGLVAIVYGFARAAEDGWAAASTLLWLLAGLALLIIFMTVESRRRAPLLPPAVLRDPNRAGSYLVVALMMAGPFGAYLFIGFFLQTVLDYSALQTGLVFLPLTAGVMTAAALAIRLTRIPLRFVMSLGLLLGAGGLVVLSRLSADSHYLSAVLPALVMIGLGMGLVVPHALNLATSGVAADDTGIASAMFNVSQQAGASLTTAAMNTAAAVTTAGYLARNPGEPAASIPRQIEGYHVASLCGAGILLIAALVALILITARPIAPPNATTAATPAQAHGQPIETNE